MKKTILLSLVAISTIAFNACSNSNAENNTASQEIVSFYDVPLVCGAAPEIGCGGKSKPVLLGLEKKNDVVSEAWLNRAGTVIAIVWNENASSELRTTTADSIFKENKMDVKLVEGKGYNKMLTDFKEKKNWYRGAEVDKLSLEEKDIIIERLLKRINSKTPLSQEKNALLKTEFAAALKNRFTKNYSSEINSNPEKVMENLKQEMENELLEIGKKHLNDTEMNALKDAIALGLRPTESEKSDCSKDQKKKSCCKKK